MFVVSANIIIDTRRDAEFQKFPGRCRVVDIGGCLPYKVSKPAVRLVGVE
jgi:hypothetical protein